jgi:multiple antibiotic resistance protein
MFLRDLSLAFIAIFVALDIIGAVPMYLGVTRGLDPDRRRRVVDHSLFVALLVAIGFAAVGREIFRYLGITLFDFRIAGGLVLLLVSLADLVGQPEVQDRASGSTGVVPLAVPIITGPGVLTTIILQIGSWGYPVTLLALLGNYLLAWIVLRNSHRIDRVIGKDGTVVTSKLSALLLSAIAVAMIRNGIFDAIREYHR